MRARWGAALAAAIAASAAVRASEGAGCELGRVDRAATPSARCLSCHDGSAGANVGAGRAGRHGTSHPVEADYEAIAAAHPGRYQPVAALPPEILLVGGRIACTTCHDGGALDRQRAVAVRTLCLACHRL